MSHLQEVKSLISDARKNGTSSARLSDCLAVQVFDNTSTAERLNRSDLTFEDVTTNPFRQSKMSFMANSLSFFDKFTPNAAPYAVYPFDNESCIDIITGRLWIVTYFNLGNLARCLRRRGLWVKLPTREELSKSVGLLPGQIRDHELDNALLVSRVPQQPMLAMSLAVVSRINYEMLDEECFADALEELLSVKVIEEEFSFMAFEKEYLLWD